MKMYRIALIATLLAGCGGGGGGGSSSTPASATPPATTPAVTPDPTATPATPATPAVPATPAIPATPDPAPSTPAPSTPAPSTPAPSTPAPSTPAPSTPAAPTAAFTITPGTISGSYVAGSPKTVRVLATPNFPFGGTTYIRLSTGEPILPNVPTFTALQDGSLYVDFLPSSTIGAGHYVGNVTVSVCKDVDCAVHFSGSPFQVPYDFTVTPAN
jgi:hypothetical protein